MTQTVYLNGDYLPASEAQVSIFDRGFLMADAVYEVTAVLDGKLLAFDAHLARLKRSLAAFAIPYTIQRDPLLAVHRKLIADNKLDCGGVYIQISRGNPGLRDFIRPAAKDNITPTELLFTTPRPPLADRPDATRGWRVMTVPDLRWQRRDIKSTQLAYQSLMKSDAIAKGLDDAWFVDASGHITEGTSNNAYIIKNGVITTRALSHDILHGITRAALLDYAKSQNMTIAEKPFSVADAQAADEAFITSAATFVTPVVEIDNKPISTGKPGKHTWALRDLYLAESMKVAL